MIDFTTAQKEDLDAIAWHFDEERVLFRAAEELGEASVAALQYIRARKGDGFGTVRRDAFIGELADACVMIEQLLILHPEWKELIERTADSKIARTLDRYDITEPDDAQD